MTVDSFPPQLRSDLELLPSKRRRGGQTYILHDPRTDWVFELGEADYFICQQLDGQTSLETLLARYQMYLGEPVAPAALDSFIDQLRQCGFLDETAAVTEEEIGELFGRDTHEIHRFILGNPDRFFAWLAPRISWCFARWFYILSSPVLLFAVWLIVREWTNYITQVDQLWQASNWVWLAPVGLFCVMIPRELHYGAACKYFGGTVPALGIAIARLRPRVFVDVTAIRWLPKPARMQVILAHGWSAPVLWAIGTIGWWLTTRGTRVNIFWLLLSAIAAWSTLWAWNPKLPMDSYHLLVTWLGTPRLRGRSMRIVSRLLFWWEPSEPLTRHELYGFLLYGVVAWLYALFHVWLIWGAVGSALVNVLQGWGTILFAVLLMFIMPAWIKQPLQRWGRWLLASSARLSIKMIVRLGLLLVFIIVLFLPYSYETGGPFRILPIQNYEIHCEIDGGLITAVLVKEGQRVEKGDVLARIDDREYKKNLDTNEAQLSSTLAQLNLLRKQLAMLTTPPNIEQILQLEAEVRRLEVVVENAKRELDLTVLRSPISGRVITPYVDQKVGQYLKKGDLFAVIQNSETVQVEIAVWEGDIPELRVGTAVRAAPWSYPDRTFDGKILSIATMGTLDATQSTVINVLAHLSNPDGLLRSAMTGYAKVETRTMRVWEVLSRRFMRWFKVEVWYWIP